MVKIKFLPIGTIYRVAEAGRIDYGEAQLDAALFNLDRRGLDVHRLLDLVAADVWHRALRVQVGQKEAVDERRLAEARLA